MIREQPDRPLGPLRAASGAPRAPDLVDRSGVLGTQPVYGTYIAARGPAARTITSVVLIMVAGVGDPWHRRAVDFAGCLRHAVAED